MTTATSARLPRGAGFWVLGATLLTFMFAASAPSPLYVVYQATWGFSATTLTTVFAVYAVALLVALLTVGGLSDHLGRRPVLLAALAAEAVAMILFATASGVGWLVLARAVQGLATGAATGAISAGLVDLQPAGNPKLGSLVNSAAPTLGLAAGALGSGLLVQYAPAPTTLVFLLLLVLFALAAAAAWFLPDTAPRRPGALASLRPQVHVPRPARRAFLLVTPSLVATWALGGLYLSLGPSLAAGPLHVHNHLVGGLVIGLLCLTGAIGSVLLREQPVNRVLLVGAAGLVLGVAAVLLAVAVTSLPLFLVGTVLAGFGFGVAFLGALRTVGGLVGASDRAGLFAALYVVSYLAFSVPAIAAGVAVTQVGLAPTAVGYGVVVVVLSALSALAPLALGRRAAQPQPTPTPVSG
jgi:predicted MFS family arabinose efflux permease